MEKVCPRCKYLQEGAYECEYCGLVFAQYNKTQITKKSNWQNAIDKKSSILSIIISLIAFIGFFGLVYFWYQHESAKKMAELEEIRKLKISEQKRKEKQQSAEINEIKRKQPKTDKDENNVVKPVKKTQETIPLATTSKQQYIEMEKKKAVLPAKNKQKTTSSVISKVFCRRFSINTVLKGKQLKFWLGTDLPDDTIVMVSVSRRYWIKGSSGTYYGSYFGKRSSVQELRKPVMVIIDDIGLRRQIEKKHKLIESSGEPYQISKISDEIELNLTVPINQDNPAFGRRNVNLEGTMVTAEQGFKIIREKKIFLVPFGKALSALARAKST